MVRNQKPSVFVELGSEHRLPQTTVRPRASMTTGTLGAAMYGMEGGSGTPPPGGEGVREKIILIVMRKNAGEKRDYAEKCGKVRAT